MRFYCVKLRDALLALIGAALILVGLGVFFGRMAEKLDHPAALGEGDNAFGIFVSSPAPEETEDGFTFEVLSPHTAERAAPRVYLYHTHTYEAYEQTVDAPYQALQNWRTADEAHNVVRVGAALASALQNAGLTVYHDTTAYEPPKLSTAYARSLTALEKTLSEPYDLYIDIHRDSYSAGNGENSVTLDGKKAARLMFLIGRGSGSALDEKPDYVRNARVASFLKDQLNARQKGLCRESKEMSGRYNQQIGPVCLLLEVGNNKNTLDEALNTISPLANAICAYFDTL